MRVCPAAGAGRYHCARSGLDVTWWGDVAPGRNDSIDEENAMPLLTEGSPAPAFSVPNQDGATVSLDQFAGKWLVLWWYPKADTPG